MLTSRGTSPEDLIIPQTNISNKVVLLHSNVLIGSDNNDKSQCYSHILLGPLVIIYYFGKKEKVM